jgi:hypothetical protein
MHFAILKPLMAALLLMVNVALVAKEILPSMPEPMVILQEKDYPAMKNVWARFEYQELGVLDSFGRNSYSAAQLLELQKASIASIIKELPQNEQGATYVRNYLQGGFKELIYGQQIQIPCYIEKARIDSRGYWLVLYFIGFLQGGPQSKRLDHYRYITIDRVTGSVGNPYCTMILPSAHEFFLDCQNTEVYETEHFRLEATMINGGYNPLREPDSWLMVIRSKSTCQVIYRQHERSGNLCSLFYQGRRAFLAEIPYKDQFVVAYAFGYGWPLSSENYLRVFLARQDSDLISVYSPIYSGYGVIVNYQQFLGYCEGLRNVQDYDRDADSETFVGGEVLNLEKGCIVSENQSLMECKDPLFQLLNSQPGTANDSQEAIRLMFLERIESELQSLVQEVSEAKRKDADPCGLWFGNYLH